MMKGLIAVIVLLLLGGGWFYMEQSCVGVYYKQEVPTMVQDETGNHEVSMMTCFGPFQKYPRILNTQQPLTQAPHDSASTVVGSGDSRYVISNQKVITSSSRLAATIDTVVRTSPLPTFSGTVTGSEPSLLGMQLYQKVPSYHGYYSGNVNVSNGHWSASLETQLPAGTYIVDMDELGACSDGATCTNNGVVTTATLTVAGDSTAAIVVPGMSKYTDNEFGFSFWYPSDWKIDSSADGSNLEDCTYKKSLSIHGIRTTNGVTIAEYYCPNRSMTLRGVGASPVGMDFKYYFDTAAHTWMVTDLSDPPNGSPRTTAPANISNNSMGGLHILAGAARFGADVVVPLSAKDFLVISTNGGGDFDERVFAKTILALDPAVATPVSLAEQVATIKAEKDASSMLDDTPLPPPVTITSISPTTANPGDTVMVYGTNFDSNTKVQLGSVAGTEVKSTFISSTILSFVVPVAQTLNTISGEGRGGQFPYRVTASSKSGSTWPGVVLTIPGY